MNEYTTEWCSVCQRNTLHMITSTGTHVCTNTHETARPRHADHPVRTPTDPHAYRHDRQHNGRERKW